MTDEMSMNVGGISFQKDQVKAHSSEQKTRVDDSGNVSAFTLYKVELQDGTKLTYETQSEDRKASVYQEKHSTKMFGLENVKVEDTPENDSYTLYGCMGLDIKADRTKKEGGGIFSSAKEVRADEDYIKVKDRVLKDGSIQVSKNNRFYVYGDHIKLQDDEHSEIMHNKGNFRLSQGDSRTIDDMTKRYR